MRNSRGGVALRTGNKKGYVLLTVVCVFAFLSALGFTLLTAALANMQSAERKLAGAQADAYAVSLAESVNGMVEAGRFEPLVSGWKQAAAASASIPDGRDSVFLPGSGPANVLRSEEIAVADPADPGADGRTVRMDASFFLSDVTVRRDPADPDNRAKYTASGTLEADLSVTCLLDGREVAIRFHSTFDAAADAGKWRLRRFVKED